MHWRRFFFAGGSCQSSEGWIKGLGLPSKQGFHTWKELSNKGFRLWGGSFWSGLLRKGTKFPRGCWFVLCRLHLQTLTPMCKSQAVGLFGQGCSQATGIY